VIGSQYINCSTTRQDKSSQVKSSQAILLQIISQSVSMSWPRAPNCDSWPYFGFERIFRYCLSWAVYPDRCTGLPCTGVTDLCVCLSRFILVVVVVVVVVVLFTKARLLSPGTAPKVYTYGSLELWMIICLTATKLELFIFPMLGFVCACVSDIFIIVSLHDFWLLPTYFVI
jgi:hypothetical protein